MTAKRITILLFLLSPLWAKTQNHAVSAKIISLINEARTHPGNFLKTHREEIAQYQQAYIGFLEKCNAIDPVAEDQGLIQMAKESVEQQNLNPIYKGSNKLCGQSSGSGKGTSLSKDPLYYVCQWYTNVHATDYRYIGVYFNKNASGYSYFWGISCDKKKIDYTFTGKVDSSKVDFNRLNTAKNITGISEVEKRMVLEVNFARAYPQVYRDIIKQHLHDLSHSAWGLSEDEYRAGIELIAELDTLKPLSILKFKDCIYKAAKVHGEDCKKRGFFAHEGSDKSMPWDRIKKQCSDITHGNENGAGNSALHPRVPNISLLIDSGISGRGHRYNMLNPAWKYIGCYRYETKKTEYYTMYQWVQKFGY